MSALDKIEVWLNADDPDFVEQFRKALGLKPGEKIEIVTPQFERTDGRSITYFPRTVEEYAALPQYREDTLKGQWLHIPCPSAPSPQEKHR